MKLMEEHMQPPAKTRNQRILIIDDNAAIHEDVRKILGIAAQADSALDADAAALFGIKADVHEESEFEIDSAYQGPQGLEMVERALHEGRPYAMAFVDVRMPPGWDGIETISRIWKKYPELQVVICTAYSDYSWADMIKQVGKNDSLVILKKPFDNIEILQLAHTLTQKWALRQELHCHIEDLDEMVARRTEELQAANALLRQEMSDREQAEKELRCSEERFAKAFQSSPIPLAIQSLATERYIDVNEAFLAMSGFRRLEIISRTPSELQLCLDSETQAKCLDHLRQGHSVRNLECTLRTRHSESRECLISADAIQLGTERVALIAALDVSDQRTLEKKLRHAQKLEAVGQFAAGVAHDFNNVLTVIQGHANLQLAAKDLDNDMTESLTQVSQAAQRAASLTKQLLMFSRKQMVQPRALNLNEVVQTLQEMLGRVIGEHIQLNCQLSEPLPAILADSGNLEQIIMNLAVNARDAMPHGGKLTIRTRVMTMSQSDTERHPQARSGRFVCLNVADTGVGMTPETLSHIFEPFFTTKEVGKGTGLGLATVHGIVAQHDGWIEVASKEFEGSSFNLFFPASSDAAQSSHGSSVIGAKGGNETILVVEDEAPVRGVIAGTLRRSGYKIIEACDGIEALKIWEEHGKDIDLLLTDIMMPNGLRGNELADRLRQERPDLRVLFSSGYSADFGTGSSPLSERVNFLEKPYKPEFLLKKVRECLDRAVSVR